MSVRFLMRAPPSMETIDRQFGTHAPSASVTTAPEEYVEISGHQAGDVVCRRATDADRRKYKAEYAAFKAPAASEPPKPSNPHRAPPPRARR